MVECRRRDAADHGRRGIRRRRSGGGGGRYCRAVACCHLGRTVHRGRSAARIHIKPPSVPAPTTRYSSSAARSGQRSAGWWGYQTGWAPSPDGDRTGTLYMDQPGSATRHCPPSSSGGPRKTQGDDVAVDAQTGQRSSQRAGERTRLGSMATTSSLGRAPVSRQRSNPAANLLTRFCSDFLAGPRQRLLTAGSYLTNELGASTERVRRHRAARSVTISDNELHTLQTLGGFSKKNTIIQPSRAHRAVIFSFEDGPATLDNQLYISSAGRTARREPRSWSATGSSTAACMSSARSTRR